MSSDFEKLKNLSNDIYNITLSLVELCNNRKDDGKTADILPLVKSLHKKADKLKNIFMNKQNKEA